MDLLILFILLSVLNVILQTVKSVVTIKGTPLAAAGINALAYFVYTFVIVYTNCELPLITKALICGITNFVGVWIVKILEEKTRKDKLWKVEATIPTSYKQQAETALTKNEISYSSVWANANYIGITCYCESQEESKIVKDVLQQSHAKFFVTEQNAAL